MKRVSGSYDGDRYSWYYCMACPKWWQLFWGECCFWFARSLLLYWLAVCTASERGWISQTVYDVFRRSTSLIYLSNCWWYWSIGPFVRGGAFVLHIDLMLLVQGVLFWDVCGGAAKVAHLMANVVYFHHKNNRPAEVLAGHTDVVSAIWGTVFACIYAIALQVCLLTRST